MPSVRTAVASCIRAGRNAPSHSIRLPSSLITVDLIVFCFFPDTNARRPGRPALGRRTCTSVPSTRSRTPGRRRRRTRPPGASIAARACPVPRTRARPMSRIVGALPGVAPARHHTPAPPHPSPPTASKCVQVELAERPVQG